MSDLNIDNFSLDDIEEDSFLDIEGIFSAPKKIIIKNTIRNISDPDINNNINAKIKKTLYKKVFNYYLFGKILFSVFLLLLNGIKHNRGSNK